MLHPVKKLERCAIVSTDGPLGTIEDVYFDDEAWVVRYLVVKTGGWLSGKKVLISPYAVQLLDWPANSVMLRLTKAQIEGSPDIDTDKPVSRQQEEALHGYYGYPAYWPYSSNWATGASPVMPPFGVDPAELMRGAQARKTPPPEGDSHLRSGEEVVGYGIEARDDLIGHVEDFLFDDETWALHYLVAKTRNWLPGKHVLIGPRQITHVEWSMRTVGVSLTRSEVEQCPEFDPEHLPPGDRESRLAEGARYT